ncbi:hypothetical protein Tco_1284546 [Tanacetum coccineum]
MENASHTTTRKGIPSTSPETALATEGEKNTNLATNNAETTNLHNELVDLLGISIVTYGSGNEEGLCKELQFSLVDNSKLNVVYLFNRSMKRFVSLIEGLQVIMEYLVNISKRCAFWSLNEDILKITILTTSTPYPSKKIHRIRACTHQRPQRKHVQYAVSTGDQYAVLEIWPEVMRMVVVVVGEDEDVGGLNKMIKLEEELVVLGGNGYSQKDKNKAKTEQNQARDWKERGKPKPKAYAS